MGSRISPIGIPVDSDTPSGRNTPEIATSPLVNGEKSIFRDKIGGYSALASPVRREIGNRSMTRLFSVGDNDLEDGKAAKDRDRPSRYLRLPKIQNQALLSGLAYCISSCSMILVNKYVLSGYSFNAGIFLMLYQNIVSVIIVSTLSLSGVIPTEPLTWKLIKVWSPVNIIFVGMLITSMFSLKYINVAMLTILKNATNVITASGETYFFKKQHDRKVWIALILMIISAIAGGITDLSFHVVGYTWQILNCFLTASYSLTLRHVMDSAKQATKSGNLNELSMVLLNNILSLPLGIILVLGFNEVEYLLETQFEALRHIYINGVSKRTCHGRLVTKPCQEGIVSIRNEVCCIGLNGLSASNGPLVIIVSHLDSIQDTSNPVNSCSTSPGKNSLFANITPLLGLCICEVNLQASLEDTDVLASHHS